MHGISAGLATCLVAAVTVGCGTVTASPSGSATHTVAPATAGNSGGCLSQAPAGSAVNTLVITLASNGKTYCVRVGDKLDVYLRSTDANPWLQPLVSSDALMPIPNPELSLVRGLTGASFAAVRSGQVLLTSVRPPCGIAIPLLKGDLEPAFPVAKAYPLRFCAPVRRFSASIIVLG